MSEKKVTPGPEELALFCARCAEDKKAEEVKVIDVSDLSSIADCYVIATAASEPQLNALSSEIERRVRETWKLHPTRIDGVGGCSWQIIDFNTVLVHLMTPEARERYALEELWSGAPSPDAGSKLEAAARSEQ